MSLEVLRLTTHLSRILKGQGTTVQEKQIYTRFWSVFSREMFQAMYASYRNRARKQPDELPSWAPLKPATIKAKKRTRKSLKLKPSLHPTWINFDSGRLLMSFKPGSASGERYIPGNEQLWELTKESLTLGTKVKYSEAVSDKRPLFNKPRVIAQWAKKAAEAALKSIVPLMKSTKTIVLNEEFNLKRVARQKGLF